MARFLELQQAWDAAGLSERVSEVNLMDLRDVRAQLAGEYSRIEVRLGSPDHGKRLPEALKVLDGQGQTARGAQIIYINLSQARKVIIGTASGAHTSSEGAEVFGQATETTGEKRTNQDAANGATSDSPADVTSTGERKTEKEPDQKPASDKKSDKAKKKDRRAQ